VIVVAAVAASTLATWIANEKIRCVGAGGRPPPHRRVAEDELFTIAEGENHAHCR
jgi:2-keto-3-deoxy-6-phosphogluconate aldolase